MGKQPISILAVDDCEDFLDALSHMLEQEGYEVAKAADGVEALALFQTQPFDLMLLDVNMPRLNGLELLKCIKPRHGDCEVIVLSAVDEVKIAVECMKHGAYYYVTKPYSSSELLYLIERALERKKLLFLNKVFKAELSRRALSSHIISRNRGFLEMLDLAERSAPSDSTILIEGASGTGKELVANFIHANSSRKTQSFMALNCSSIPETLIESELFGHEKGAFTDATSTEQGLVEMADGGTLFLDEIGEMSLTVQPKVLRFLQTGEFRRVGSNKNLKADVRIVSATNKDLRQEAVARRFREDLLFRLNVITLQLPSLRERKDDIPLLVNHFLRQHAGAKEPKRLDERALEVLMKYDWPGNVRELENVMERAVILSQDDVIYFDDLALPLKSRPAHDLSSKVANAGIQAGSPVSMTEMQRAHVAGVLRAVSGNKEVAAKILGMSVKTLYSKMQAYNLGEVH
ncbi:MAG: sigma-54 dependent transcriptional regulator [Ignavibacteriales bacterium]|nr:sigma-54 dependent transcriptional regulator [Ignavibacteriales bacterium]